MRIAAILTRTAPAGISHAVTALGALLLQWLLARYLSIDAVGIFFALVTLLMTVDLLVRFGIEQTIFRTGGHFFLTGDRERFDALLVMVRGYVLRRSLVAALIIACLVFPIDRWFLAANQDYVLVMLVAALVPFFSLAIPWAAGLRCRGLTALAPLWGPGGIAALTAVALSVVWQFTDPDLGSAAVVYALVALTLAIPFLSLRFGTNRDGLLEHASDYGIAQICQFVIQWGVLLVVAGLGPPSEVAVFNAALRIAATINFVLMIFNGVLAPYFANYYKLGNVDELAVLARNATRIMTAVAFVPFAAIAFFAEEILMQFGDQYSDAAMLLRILAVAQFLNVLAGPVLNILNMSGYQRDVKYITVVSGASTLLVSVPVYIGFGLVGMAWTIAAAIILNNFLAVLAIKKRLGFIPIR